MSAASNFLENKMLDWLFRGQALGITGASAAAGSGPTNVYIGLCTGAPGEATFGTEVAGNSYARVARASNLTNWLGTQGTTAVSSGTTGTISNNGIVQFATPTGNWGDVTHFIIADALVNGNLLFYGTLQSPRNIVTGQDVNFPTGTLQITLG